MADSLRTALVHTLAWAAAAGAAVTLSWWGVHTVLTGTAYEPPRALPVAGPSGTPRDEKPVTSSTRRPKPSPSRTTSADPPPPSGSPSKPRPSRSPTPSASPDQAADDGVQDGVVHRYDTRGGRVVLDIGSSTASLVSATPRSGWSMQVWKTSTWIRVDFRAGADEVTLLCDWYRHRPQVQIVSQ